MELPSNPALCLFTVAFLLQGHRTWLFEEDGDDGLTRTHRAERVSPGFCPDGWFIFGEMCYKIGTRTRSWESALRDCTDMDSHLVSIHNQEEQDFLNLLVMEIRTPLWIGLKRSSIQREQFEWEDSSPLDYTNWEEGKPSNYTNSDNCTALHYNRGTIGEWNNVMCNDYIRYVCKKPKDPALSRPGQDPAMCPDKTNGWLKLRDSCYKIFHRTDSFLSWSQAQSLCKSYGGNLAYVKNPAVNKLLEMKSKEMQGPFWTGIKSSKMHKYTWLGMKHALMYSNWQTDQPNELPDRENCVAMDAEGKWIIRDCEERHPFICEIGPELPDAPVLEPFGENMTCPDTSQKWQDIGGKYCYIIEITARFKWREAFCRCREEGGSLASVHSGQEADVIRHYINHHDVPVLSVFVGLVRDERGSYRWTDGSAYDYSNWRSMEQNRYTSQCGAIHMLSRQWFAVHCQEKLEFVCSTLKVPQREKLISKTKKINSLSESGEGAQQLSAGSITLITVTCLLVLTAVSVVSLYCFGNSLKEKVVSRFPYSGIK